MLSRLCFLWASAALPAVCVAQSLMQEDADRERARVSAVAPVSESRDERRPRLRFYEPMYAVYQHTKDDENSFRLHYSFRYTLFAPDCRAAQGKAPSAKTSGEARRCEGPFVQDEFYLMYTGEFDFYMGTRDSGPVVNRISNPGAHYRRYYGESRFNMRWWDVGFEHKSDGQTTDPDARVSDTDRRVRAQVEYLAGNHAYFDSISRDTNYMTVEGRFGVGKQMDLWARVKPFYFGNKTDITWGPMADQKVRMSDYDRFRFVLAYALGERKPERELAEQPSVFAEWTVGDKALKTDSFNFGVYLPFRMFGFDIPFFARAHYGPLHTLSDFTKEQSSIGFGLLLLP